jgi:hypothetical protein
VLGVAREVVPALEQVVDCAARGLTPSKFYAERAKQGAPQGMVPIVVEASALRITLSLRTSVEISGSAADIAQVLRCL